MVALSIIDALNEKISKFLTEEDELDYMSDKEYEEQLDGLYKESTEGIIRRLKHHLQRAPKEECDDAKSRLITDLEKLQAKLKELRNNADLVQYNAHKCDNEIKHLDSKVRFCARITKFYKNLIVKVEKWSEGALTIAESNGCFFYPPKKNISLDSLSFIYQNLIARSWIDRKQTSEEDFIYYFTGKGLTPPHPIRWMKKKTSLGILLNELTDDKDKWSKATAIFTTYSSKEHDYIPIDRKSLGNNYRQCLGTDSYRRQMKLIQCRILTPPQEQMELVMSRYQ